MGVPVLLPLILGFLALGWAGGASAEVFTSRAAALELAFPAADSISVQDYTLSPAEARAAESVGGVPVESRLITAYRGWSGGRVVATAYFDTHNVRTLPETILLVVGADGTTSAIHLLAFHEPPEYKAPPEFLAQFRGRALTKDLGVGRGISGIAGSTLTSHAITAAVRRILAVHRVLHDEAGSHRPAASMASIP